LRNLIMLKYKMQFIILAIAAWLSAFSGVHAETRHLSKSEDWKVVSVEEKDKYLLSVAKIKQLVSAGKTREVRKAWDQLRKDFPEISGAELDAFIEAEMFFSKGKFAKAIRSYDKFLAAYPQGRLREAALDRQFAIATAFLAGQKVTVLGIFRIKGYAEGEKIMNKISDLAGDAPIGIKAAVAVAENYETRGKFAEAYHKWSQISSQWPTEQINKYALLSMARCKHAAYKGPKYDGSYLVSAKSYYENFKLRYPGDVEGLDIDKKLRLIDEQRAYKEFQIGEYYRKSDNKQSANFYYQMVINNWSNTKAAEIAKQR